MPDFFDDLEIREPQQREQDLFSALPGFLAQAIGKAEGLAKWLQGIDPAKITSRQALATLPVLRKPDLMAMQAANPPFGGLADPDALRGNHVFMSPGPVWEPQGFGADPWQPPAPSSSTRVQEHWDAWSFQPVSAIRKPRLKRLPRCVLQPLPVRRIT